MKTEAIIKKVFVGGDPFSLDQVLEVIDAYERRLPSLDDLNSALNSLILTEGLIQISPLVFMFKSGVQGGINTAG